MSELQNICRKATKFRLQLLATASAIAFVGATLGGGEVKASDDDSDRSTVWVELGGQLSRLDSGQESFTPPLFSQRPAIFSPSQEFERSPRYGIDESGKISIEPSGSHWMLSATVLYGRLSNNRHTHQQTHPGDAFIVTMNGQPVPSVPPQPPLAARFADTVVRNNESHLILDFQVGRDVGLGMFGDRGISSINAGVRFAQFNSRANVSLKSDPDWQFSSINFGTFRVPAFQPYHSNLAHLSAARNFHGVGPSLSWDASLPLTDRDRNSEVTIDWGLNVAVLFGRQRANVAHEQTGHYHGKKYAQGAHATTYHPTPMRIDRTKSVTSPNVGGYVGLSWHLANFKASFGYRADYFFGAMDGGIDERKSENVGLRGPFASVSIGLGG